MVRPPLQRPLTPEVIKRVLTVALRAVRGGSPRAGFTPTHRPSRPDALLAYAAIRVEQTPAVQADVVHRRRWDDHH